MEKKNLELYKEFAKDAPVEGCEIMYHDIIVEREKEIEKMTKAKEYWEAELAKNKIGQGELTPSSHTTVCTYVYGGFLKMMYETTVCNYRLGCYKP